MAKKPYKQLKQELDAVLTWFEEGDIDLDKAMERYEQGMELVAQLETYLKEAENKITKIKADHKNGS